ncbi:MAG TPA: hypothetical protein VGZ00_02795 [Candidatus Baltobacteraceae bacterium]|nr:hypothetical protein [Candidatus Baltobacteraceae bacterium]
MPDVQLPLSGNLTQSINPWSWAFDPVGSQLGLINVNLGQSSNPQIERQILDEVGSYGKQLGRIGDVLRILLKHAKLSEDEQKAISDFENQINAIDKIKKRAASSNGAH